MDFQSVRQHVPRNRCGMSKEDVDALVLVCPRFLDSGIDLIMVTDILKKYGLVSDAKYHSMLFKYSNFMGPQREMFRIYLAELVAFLSFDDCESVNQ